MILSFSEESWIHNLNLIKMYFILYDSMDWSITVTLSDTLHLYMISHWT